jgi:hypothetical protein
MPYGWTTALRRAGLSAVTTRSWLIELPPPVRPEEAERIAASLAYWVERLRPTGLLGDDDLAAWDRLTDPEDDAWIGRRDDVFRLKARSVHVGVRP